MAIQREKWVCFTCRKMFRPYLAGGPKRATAPPCPQCKQPMRRIGRYFQPPKQSQLKQWRKVEILLDNGVDFYGYQPRPPKRPTEVKAYLQENPTIKPMP